jgi:hypothetical protein
VVPEGTKDAGESRRSGHQLRELVQDEQDRLVLSQAREVIQGVVPVDIGIRPQVSEITRERLSHPARYSGQLFLRGFPAPRVEHNATAVGELPQKSGLADPTPPPYQRETLGPVPPALESGQLPLAIDELHDTNIHAT